MGMIINQSSDTYVLWLQAIIAWLSLCLRCIDRFDDQSAYSTRHHKRAGDETLKPNTRMYGRVKQITSDHTLIGHYPMGFRT
jgi:hypothetical protein